MGKMASPHGAIGVNKIVESLAYCSDSAFCLAIGLVMISGSHVEINFYISHELHPEAGGELGVSIQDDRSRETMDREDSFNEEISRFDCSDVLGDWDEVGEPSEAIQHN